ncbi:hypothetical protein [Amycolatopsis orientalis]|uniref:hypothetical protein n=1 Tax=Amycolatopsis orientalis TaxID=31958 RepID=UPI00055E7EA9|nr:hypothetical protein [Amycolatopsis orientalis]
MIVVLSDKARSSAFMLTSSDSAVLSPDAADILYREFMIEEDAANAGGGAWRDRYDSDWGQAVVDEQVLRNVDAQPERGHVSVSEVGPGQIIAPNPTEGADDITVEVAGTVTRRLINRTELYWFEADTDLAATYGYAVPRQAAGAIARGDMFNTKLMARRVGGGLGVSCAGCAVCAVCGGCAGCAICGPSPAAALGLVGVDTTLGIVGVAGSSLAAEALRDH